MFLNMLWQPTRPFEFTSSVIDELEFKWLAIKPVSTLIFAVPKLRKLLTPTGKLLLTTPAAPVGQLFPAWRVYSPPALAKLLNRYFVCAVPTAVALVEAIK